MCRNSSDQLGAEYDQLSAEFIRSTIYEIHSINWARNSFNELCAIRLFFLEFDQQYGNAFRNVKYDVIKLFTKPNRTERNNKWTMMKWTKPNKHEFQTRASILQTDREWGDLIRSTNFQFQSNFGFLFFFNWILFVCYQNPILKIVYDS